MQYDVIVIGGGAAGLSAALTLGRARRRVAVIDAGEPRNAPADRMQGFLSRDGLSPVELSTIAREEVGRYGVEVIDDRVVSLEVGFQVALSDGRCLSARRILLATGARDEIVDLPGFRERWGRDVLHCPYCHGWEVRDQPIGVLGDKPEAPQHALQIRQWSDDVVLFEHELHLSTDERRRLQARGVEVVPGHVEGLVIDDDRLTGVRLADGTVVARSALFVHPTIRPHPDSFIAGLGCELGEDGVPVIDAAGCTSVRGVWAAGNVADPCAQVITAASQGAAAAIAINADLVEEEVEQAVAALDCSASVN